METTVKKRERFDEYGYEIYNFDNLPKETQKVVIAARARDLGIIPTGTMCFNTAAEATAFLNAKD